MFGGIRDQFMQCEAEALRRFGLEADVGTVNRYLLRLAIQIMRELRAYEFPEGRTVPAFLDQNIVGTRQRLDPRTEPLKEYLDAASVLAVCRAIAWITASKFFERCVSSRIRSRRWASLSFRSVISTAAPVTPTISPETLRMGSTWKSYQRATAPLSTRNSASRGIPRSQNFALERYNGHSAREL